MIKNTSSHYGIISILQHWIGAILLIGLFILGIIMVDWDYTHPYYYEGPHFHESLGIIFAILLLVRIIWRLVNPKPTPLSSNQLQQRLAKYAHQLLYLLMVAIPISGYLISSADGRSVKIFSWFEVPAITDILDIKIDNLATTSGDIHYWLSIAIIALTVLHIAAALKHHFVEKDDTLKRILKSHSKK